MSRTPQTRQYRYYDFVMAAYVCVLLCSNLIGPAKETSIRIPGTGFTLTFLAGVLFFPISYIFGDILTEVYGYARDRRVVWAGFGALAFASIMAAVVVRLPPSQSSLATQQAVQAVFGNTPRIVLASISAFLCGTFVNSYVLAKMKIWTGGRWLWTRIVGSTLCGELVDSAIFYTLAFYGLKPWPHLLLIMFTQYGLKSGWEILAAPLTYRVVAFLKRAEHEDYYDIGTNFTPFSLRA
ncbi:MAG TPA: queuosine precursor transporter [Steroidobacteraceae bacterium]|nr:queuosine precursor transporter [Steroidobacteraceae bacterium]